MADSDNSRTLSSVTLGDVHSLTAASLPKNPEAAARQNPGFGRSADDPALAAWQFWRSAWSRLNEVTSQHQQIETSLFSGDLSCSGGRDASRAYNEALEAEDRAAMEEEQAAQDLWKVSAVSVAGAAAKLDAMLSRGQPSPTTSDEPWPQLRGVMADLLRIDLAVDPPGRLTTSERQPALQSS